MGTIQTVHSVTHSVQSTSGYDAAVDQAHAAWASVGVSALSAVATLLAVFVALVIPWLQQRARTRNSIANIIAAQEVLELFSSGLGKSSGNVEIRELISKARIAQDLLQSASIFSSDDVEVTLLIANMNTTVMIFIGLMEFHLHRGAEVVSTASASDMSARLGRIAIAAKERLPALVARYNARLPINAIYE